jgi:SAM-dependent methyltransferase
MESNDKPHPPVSSTLSEDHKHWDDYYHAADEVQPPPGPSQFAAFVLTELNGLHTRVVDFGCGNGRDTSFFAKYGLEVLGVDNSAVAIETCRENFGRSAQFVHGDVSDSQTYETIKAWLGGSPERDTTIYSRFFFHAVDEKTGIGFLKMARELITPRGRAAFEFRTRLDEDRKKATPHHFRRFIDPQDFARQADTMGFRISYFVEGFGLAKFQTDDAHVARFILELKDV